MWNDRGAAQRLAGADSRLLVQLVLEGNRLRPVKGLEVLVTVRFLKSRQRLSNDVDRSLIPALRFLQIDEVFALDPGVCGIVFCHGMLVLSVVTIQEGFGAHTYARACFPDLDVQIGHDGRDFCQSGAAVHNGAAGLANGA